MRKLLLNNPSRRKIVKKDKMKSNRRSLRKKKMAEVPAAR
jgi:hypothetical protein|tara:strand:+ start:667 stop:786 length:120 start_codon:yes stop_codon:yes gene_type:complete